MPAKKDEFVNITPADVAAAMGGTPDPVDSEDFTDQDRGNVVTPEVPVVEPVAKAKEPAKEPDAETERTAETETSAAKEPAKEPDAKPDSKQWIPKDRFDKVNDRRRVAEEALAAREAAEAKLAAVTGPDAFDYDAAEQTYAEAILDGKLDEAKAMRSQIRAAEKHELRMEAAELAEGAVKVQNEKSGVDEIISEAEEAFAEFNPNSEVYNQELAEDVIAQYEVRILRGDKKPEAMRKAVEIVALLNNLEFVPGYQDEKTVPAQPDPKIAEKKATAVADKVEKANKAPPALAQAGSVGGTATEYNFDTMSDKEMSALPESTLKRLRGDFVAA